MPCPCRGMIQSHRWSSFSWVQILYRNMKVGTEVRYSDMCSWLQLLGRWGVQQVDLEHWRTVQDSFINTGWASMGKSPPIAWKGSRYGARYWREVSVCGATVVTGRAQQDIPGRTSASPEKIRAQQCRVLHQGRCRLLPMPGWRQASKCPKSHLSQGKPCYSSRSIQVNTSAISILCSQWHRQGTPPPEARLWALEGLLCLN